YAESDIVWTPAKARVPGPRSTSEERTTRTVKIRKRITDSALSDSGVQRKRSCAIRTDLFQSEINLSQDEVFEADDFSPNVSHASERSTSSSRSLSRSFTRTQSTGQLERGESQQGSPKFGPTVEYSLPGVEHPQRESLAFRSISGETLATEIRRLGPEEFERRYLLIDCRYPYEYEGGHVKCAINLHDQNELESLFFPEDPNHPIRSRIPIFYCEFSQKRGPGMALALRSIDRMRNELNYPKVDYAEMYLLDHGYRKFWNDGCYKSECVPCGYVPMTDSAHVSSLVKYKWHSKSTSQLTVREPLRKTSLYRHRSLMQVCTEIETTEVAISPTAKTPLLAPRRLEFTDSPEWDSAE
ncbi:rhodanese-like protein, partial [Ostertagia ostertagi]